MQVGLRQQTGGDRHVADQLSCAFPHTKQCLEATATAGLSSELSLTRVLSKDAVEAVVRRLLPLLLLAAVEELAADPLPALVVRIHVEAVVALLIVVVQVGHFGAGCNAAAAAAAACRLRGLAVSTPYWALAGQPQIGRGGSARRESAQEGAGDGGPLDSGSRECGLCCRMLW